MGRMSNVLASLVERTYASNPWVPFNYSFQPEFTMLGGPWSSNMAKYTVKLGDVVGQASYAFGNMPGHMSYGSQSASAPRIYRLLRWLRGGLHGFARFN